MKVLVACEMSGAVRDAFIAKGHDAISCDLMPSEKAGPHYQGDVMNIIDGGFDMVIAFPPCTHLAVSGAKHFKRKREDGRQYEGINFFMKFAKLTDMFADFHIPKVVIENPVGIMSTRWRKPDQIIQPWQFGDEAQKTTCLWLKGVQPLKHTKIVDKGEFVTTPSGKRLPKWYSDNKSSISRSKTFPGIANAMAEQWG